MQVCALPGEAESLAVSDYTDTSVVLTWAAPSDTGCSGARITGYQVYMAQGANPYSLVHEAGPSVLSLTQYGLSAGQSYYFKVFVCNADGCEVGTPANGLLFEAGEAPVYAEDPIALVEATQTSIEVSWTTAPTSSLTVTGFRLWYDAGDPTGSPNTLIYDGTATSHKQDNPALITGSTYRFQVQAENANGWGPRSGIVSFVASEGPGVPLNLAYYSSTLQTLEVQWDAPAALHTLEASLISYEVQWSDQTTNSETEVFTTSPAFRYGGPAVPLSAGHTYRFEVRACSLNGCGDWTSKLDLVCGALPEAPSSPFVVSSTATEITIGWSYAGRDNGGVALSQYSVQVSADGGDTYTHAGYTADASINSFTYSCGAQQTFYFKAARADVEKGAT
ncbi:unnamed protein product [Prorocentrum cordatum]|uniref:Fibronectin type-III domain-containing protein n=1 Tax=Prorocentrum cordatum TaxID=2364126 RepID=A0ABN9TX12_9DINO|nr:unnamed protein product [Polarella glacialis]